MGQAGYPPLDYSDWDQNKADYFAAIRQGLEMNYAPMIELVAQVMGNN
jgi:cell filamentation protein